MFGPFEGGGGLSEWLVGRKREKEGRLEGEGRSA